MSQIYYNPRQYQPRQMSYSEKEKINLKRSLKYQEQQYDAARENPYDYRQQNYGPMYEERQSPQIISTTLVENPEEEQYLPVEIQPILDPNYISLYQPPQMYGPSSQQYYPPPQQYNPPPQQYNQQPQMYVPQQQHPIPPYYDQQYPVDQYGRPLWKKSEMKNTGGEGRFNATTQLNAIPTSKCHQCNRSHSGYC